LTVQAVEQAIKELNTAKSTIFAFILIDIKLFAGSDKFVGDSTV
jgi:hypothetical protein